MKDLSNLNLLIVLSDSLQCHFPPTTTAHVDVNNDLCFAMSSGQWTHLILLDLPRAGSTFHNLYLEWVFP
jgi:hypothetical protein